MTSFYAIFALSLKLFTALKKTPNQVTGRLGIRSLTMTYFHTGIRTIIGAEAFHCPVRDGKEWCHLAMVVRQNFLSFGLFSQKDQFIELISFDLTNTFTILCEQNFEYVNLA
jgi:hypothetical protein